MWVEGPNFDEYFLQAYSINSTLACKILTPKKPTIRTKTQKSYFIPIQFIEQEIQVLLSKSLTNNLGEPISSYHVFEIM